MAPFEPPFPLDLYYSSSPNLAYIFLIGISCTSDIGIPSPIAFGGV